MPDGVPELAVVAVTVGVGTVALLAGDPSTAGVDTPVATNPVLDTMLFENAVDVATAATAAVTASELCVADPSTENDVVNPARTCTDRRRVAVITTFTI